MSDTGEDSTGKVRSLKETIRKVRTAEAERSDVVVELRDAERARLELLADELRGVFAEVPDDNDQFIFTVAAGTPPRLWIDMTAFVVMARDRRTYRFLKDTRLGRTIVLETAKLEDMGDTITHYVAERIIERERSLEGDWLLKRITRDEPDRRREREGRTVREAREMLEARSPGAAVAATPAVVQTGAQGPLDSRVVGWIVAAFLGGILIGVVALFGYAWVSVS